MNTFNFDNTESITKSQERIEETVANEIAYQQALVQKTAVLQATYETIKPVLAKMGLEIFSLTYRINRDAAFPHMNIEMTLHSTGKFKFMHFNGYTASGSGRNEKKLREKASKIEEAINVTDAKFMVNQFSLEVRNSRLNSGQQPRVLVSGWIK